MPKNPACPGVPRVTDPITDQEMAFALLVHVKAGSREQMLDAAPAAASEPYMPITKYSRASGRVRRVA